MKKFVALAAVACIAALISGCASMSEHMAPAQKSCYAPQAGKALVIFLRPSIFGGGIQSSVFDVTPTQTTLIGIVSAKTRIAYQASPGPHRFMVIGENADFMLANLTTGKTYYVLDEVRMGVWKSRFSLLPIRNDTTSPNNVHSNKFAGWLSATRFVETTPGAYAWYEEHKASVEAKQQEYWAKWQTKSAADKGLETLNPEDGLSAPMCEPAAAENSG